MNSQGCSLLDIGWNGVLTMRAADQKRWLQAIMMEREDMEHMGAQEQGHMQAVMESWLASGWSKQEGEEGSWEVQGSIRGREQRGLSLGELPGAQTGEEEHGAPG